MKLIALIDGGGTKTRIRFLNQADQTVVSEVVTGELRSDVELTMGGCSISPPTTELRSGVELRTGVELRMGFRSNPSCSKRRRPASALSKVLCW